MTVGLNQSILLESLQRFLVIEIVFLYFIVCSKLFYSTSLTLFNLNLEYCTDFVELNACYWGILVC